MRLTPIGFGGICEIYGLLFCVALCKSGSDALSTRLKLAALAASCFLIGTAGLLTGLRFHRRSWAPLVCIGFSALVTIFGLWLFVSPGVSYEPGWQFLVGPMFFLPGLTGAIAGIVIKVFRRRLHANTDIAQS